MSIADQRRRACETLFGEIHAITAVEGITPSTLHAIKLKLIELAARADLFPTADFEPPAAQGRNLPLLVESNDGLGLYLVQSLPGKEAAPHDHGIWCITAAISGAERHEFFRRTDDGAAPGRATVQKTGEVLVEPGTAMAMADHDIHGQVVVGDQPFIGLSLYGYALERFPAVTWFHPQFRSVRVSPSRRHAVAA
jgi:predicted metal-dependent enzyme (double-stranded beta helix superfamily)